jgi:hypothetical protein
MLNKKEMRNSLITTSVYLFIILLMVTASSCKLEHVTVPPEPDKNITGTWKIATVLQNSATLFDTTKALGLPKGFDFTQFRVTFKGNAYTTNTAAPFIVSSNGTYSLNEPYTTKLTFKPDTSKAVSLDFYYPVTGGARQLIITFSPGCPSNSYEYILEKVN